jgi:2-polyprenyl-6-methoxyphenol hydroxylase-like FAD-dependent oxidoreductase
MSRELTRKKIDTSMFRGRTGGLTVKLSREQSEVMAEELSVDVAAVGLGPTGMTAAALLAKMNHRVAVFERWNGLYGLPRAGHVDHEIVRVIQDLGVHKIVLQDAFPTEDYKWYNAKREVILDFPWGGLSESGFNSDYMMYQPVLEDAV